MFGRIIVVGFLVLCAALPVYAEDDAEADREQAAMEREQAEIERAIDAVTLAEKPTREQCADYVYYLAELSAKRREGFSNYNEVGKLGAVPVAHYDLLAAEIMDDSPLSFCAAHLLSHVDPETYRASVIARLGQRPDNIWFVAQNGWYKLAEGTILGRFKDAGGKTEPAWFQAFTEVAGPEHYAKLHEIAIESDYIAAYIPLLETLPDYDVGETIRVAWKSMTQEPGSLDNLSDEASVAFIFYAAQAGEIDALAMMVGQLDEIGTAQDGVVDKRIRINRCIDYRGSNDDVKAWFAANRDELLFDHHRKRFVVPEAF